MKEGDTAGMSFPTWSFLPGLDTVLVLSAARHAPETEVTNKVNEVTKLNKINA